MYAPKIEVGFGTECRSHGKIVVDINEIPYPTAVYIPSKEEVILNRRAYSTLGMQEGNQFDIEKWRKINPYLSVCDKNFKEDIVTDQKVHVVLFNNKHVIMNYSLTRITNPLIGKVFIIHFTKASEKYSVASISSLYSVKDDVAKLKPYLNRAGKSIHESLMKKYFREENQQLTLDDLVYYERELRLIQKTYRTLSHREVILCGLLVNDMDSKDIAVITNRTLDAVFVTIHRINKKLDLLNKKQLIDTLKALVNK